MWSHRRLYFSMHRTANLNVEKACYHCLNYQPTKVARAERGADEVVPPTRIRRIYDMSFTLVVSSSGGATAVAVV